MAKKKLIVEDTDDYFLFGISCPEKSYRLCFALNNKLTASFSKSKDIEVEEKNQKIQLKFPVFVFRNEDMFTDYRILVNRVGNKFLIPEFKQADYLLMVQGSVLTTEKETIFKKIKEITFIQTAFEIDPKKIKSKEKLAF